MKALFVNVGGHRVFVSRDDGCATDMGNVYAGDPNAEPVPREEASCEQPVVALIIGRSPNFRENVVITPKCREHFAEVEPHIPNDSVVVDVEGAS